MFMYSFHRVGAYEKRFRNMALVGIIRHDFVVSMFRRTLCP